MSEAARLAGAKKILRSLADGRAFIHGVPERLAIISGEYALQKAQEFRKLEGRGQTESVDFIPLEQFIESHARRLCNIRPGNWTTLNGFLGRKPDAKLVNRVDKFKNIARDIIGDERGIPRDRMQGFTKEILLALVSASKAEVLEGWARKPTKAGTKLNWPACCVALVLGEVYPLLSGKTIGTSADHDFVRTLDELYRQLGFSVSAQNYAKHAKNELIDRA